MPKLNAKQETILKVDSSELDRFISEIYGFEYESAPDMEASNDSLKKVPVGYFPQTDYDRESMKVWVESKGMKGNYMLSNILGDLHHKGHLPKCMMYVEFSW